MQICANIQEVVCWQKGRAVGNWHNNHEVCENGLASCRNILKNTDSRRN